eukprot:g47527.t1
MLELLLKATLWRWVLKVNKTFKTLDIAWNSIGAQGAENIAQAMKLSESSVNKNLQTLWIASNNVGDKGAATFADALKEKKERSTAHRESVGGELNPHHSRYWQERHRTTRCAVNSYQGEESLKELKFWNNSIGPEGAKAIAAALEVNKTLTTLNLWNNKIGDEGAAHIAAAVKEVGLPLALRLRQQLEEEPNPFRCAEFKKQLDQIRPQVEQEHAKVESIQKRAVDELTEMASMQTLRVKELNAKQEKAEMTLSQCKQTLPKAKKAYEKAVQALTKAKKTYKKAVQALTKATKHESEATHAVAEGKQALTQAEEALEIAKERQREKARLGAEVEELLVAREKSWKAQFHSWSEQDVQQWLQALAGGQFAHLAPEFKLNGIDGQQLAGLQDDVQLRRCGVNKNKDRLELWPHVEALVQPPRKKRRIAECKICEEKPASIILAPCGHKSLCLECAMHLRQNQKPCPICQTAIDGIVQKVYEP